MGLATYEGLQSSPVRPCLCPLRVRGRDSEQGCRAGPNILRLDRMLASGTVKGRGRADTVAPGEGWGTGGCVSETGQPMGQQHLWLVPVVTAELGPPEPPPLPQW